MVGQKPTEQGTTNNSTAHQSIACYLPRGKLWLSRWLCTTKF